MGIKARDNADGIIELYDEDTGEVVATQKTKGRPVRKDGKRKVARTRWTDDKPVHKVMGPDGKKVWAYKGVNPDHIPREVWPYSQTMVDHICAMIADGVTLQKIGQMDGMPSRGALYRWQTDPVHGPDFRARLKEARKLRAEVYHDKVMEIAESTEKETVMEDRLKKEIYQWGAEKGDPDEYGVRVKHAGDVNAPMTWVISTGVPSAEAAIEVKSEPAPPSSDVQPDGVTSVAEDTE